jgi:hypothetical protein
MPSPFAMRCLSVAMVIAVVACHQPSAVETAPPAQLSGEWSSWPPHQAPTPAGPMTFAFTQTGDSISGSGGWADEQWTLVGTYVKPNAMIVRTTNFGSVRVDTLFGLALDGTRLKLTSASNPGGAVFYKEQ